MENQKPPVRVLKNEYIITTFDADDMCKRVSYHEFPMLFKVDSDHWLAVLETDSRVAVGDLRDVVAVFNRSLFKHDVVLVGNLWPFRVDENSCFG